MIWKPDVCVYHSPCDEGTSVDVEKSIAEIIALVKRAGAVRVAQVEEPESFAIWFSLHERRIRFRVKLPQLDDMPQADGRSARLTTEQRAKRRDQAARQRARALLLVVKAKLESVESEVETFEEAFLANVVMSDGNTIYERISRPIALEYQASPQILLEGPR